MSQQPTETTRTINGFTYTEYADRQRLTYAQLAARLTYCGAHVERRGRAIVVTLGSYPQTFASVRDAQIALSMQHG